MTWQHLVNDAVLERVGWTLAHFIWQACLVGAVLWWVLRFLPGRSQLRYLIACVGLLVLTVLPIGTFVVKWVVFQEPILGSALTRAELHSAQDALLEMQVQPASRWQWVSHGVSSLEQWIQSLSGPLAGAWASGLALFLIYQAMCWWGMQRSLSHSAALTPERLASFIGLSRKMGVAKVRWVVSAVLDTPATVGWLKPVVIVPMSGLTGLAPELLEALIVHELAHIRRFDYLVNLLQIVVEQLFFFHPVVWWVSAVIRQERECCCDEISVGVVGKGTYSRALHAMESIRQPSSPNAALAASGGSLLSRVKRMLEPSRVHSRRNDWGSLLASFLAVSFAFLLLIVTVQSDEVWWYLQKSRPAGAAALNAVDLESDSTAFLQPYAEALAVRHPTDEQYERLARTMEKGVDPEALLREGMPFLSALDRWACDNNPNWRYNKHVMRFAFVDRLWKRAKALEPTDPDKAYRFARVVLVLSCEENVFSSSDQTSDLLWDPAFTRLARITPHQRDRLRRVVLADWDHSKFIHGSIPLEEAINQTFYCAPEQAAAQVAAQSPRWAEQIEQCARFCGGRVALQRHTANHVYMLRSRDRRLAEQVKERLESGLARDYPQWRKWLNDAMTAPQDYVPAIILTARAKGQRLAAVDPSSFVHSPQLLRWIFHTF